MLHDHQQKYLDSLPHTDKVACILPFDPKTQTVAQNLINEIKKALPETKIIYQGSTYLGIAGENDIDLTVINSDFEKALKSITDLFGEAKNIDSESKYAHWDFKQEGFDVDMGLQTKMTPMLEEQLKTQEILEENNDLKMEYEQMKLKSNGLPWKEYLIRKYEFWNRVIGSK